MTRSNSTLVAVAIVIFGASLGASVRAEQVTYTASTSPDNRPTDFSQTLLIPSFDKTKGVLSGVTISYNVNESFQGTLTNMSSITQNNFTVAEATIFTLTLNPSTQLLNNALGASQFYSSLASKATANFQMAPGTPYTASQNLTPVNFVSGSSVLNAFQTSNPEVDLTFATMTDTKVTGGGGNIQTGIYTNASATVTVIYTYVAASNVPEPASIAMTGIGTLFVSSSCWLIRRRRQTSKPTV